MFDDFISFTDTNRRLVHAFLSGSKCSNVTCQRCPFSYHNSKESIGCIVNGYTSAGEYSPKQEVLESLADKLPDREYELFDKLATLIGVAAPESEEERNMSSAYRCRVLRTAIKSLIELLEEGGNGQ